MFLEAFCGKLYRNCDIVPELINLSEKQGIIIRFLNTILRKTRDSINWNCFCLELSIPQVRMECKLFRMN